MKAYLRTVLSIASVAILYTLATPAHAQATRTWVSGVGDDVNPCSRTAPCKTFAGAISKTAAGGEINCLDSGGFGGVTITKSISIICGDIGIAGVLVSGTNGIIVNSATAKVLLEGLDIEGLGTGLNGVHIIAATRVTIRRTSIRNFTQFGVDLQANLNAKVSIENCQILNNGSGGLLVQGALGVANNAIVANSMFDNNGPVSIKIASPGTVFVNNSMLTGATAALGISGGGAVTSYGDNVIRGTGLPTTTLPRL